MTQLCFFIPLGHSKFPKLRNIARIAQLRKMRKDPVG